MIKVNLLRTSSASQAAGSDAVSKDVQKQAAARILLILLFPAALYLYETFHISALTTEVDALRARVQAVEEEKESFGDAAPKVEEFNKEKKRVDGELDVVRALAKLRLREVKSLDTLQGLIPQEAWFHRVTIQENLVKLTGFARNDQTFTKLIRNLQDSVFFSRIEPKSTSQEMLSTGPAKKFEVEFMIGQGET